MADNIFSMLEQVMDLRSKKHNIIVSNISNRDTPGYKSFGLVMEEEVKKRIGQHDNVVLKKTDPAHLPRKSNGTGSFSYKIDEKTGTDLRCDGNTVDIDREMARLSKNSLMYNVSAQILSKKFQSIENAIKGGR